MINSGKVELDDQATPFLVKALREMERRQPIHQAMAEGGTALVQENFAKLAVTNRNRFGARSGFWQRMLGGTKALATQSYGYIVTPGPVALRYFGGTVKPVRRKFLSIPARAEAYNKSPRDFNDLRFIKTRRGGMLVQTDQTQFSRGQKGKTGERRQAGGAVMYWLVRSVTVRGDDKVLPDLTQLAQACVDAGEGFIRRRLGL